MLDSPIITAVICTRNNAHFLDKCIKSLLRQSLDREKYEILVVDNGSTDETANILRRYNQEPILRSVYEPVIGLSRARNTGWREASGLYVGYIDDDAIAEEGWLESALWCFENLSPMPDWVGGTIELEWETEPSIWMNEELCGPLGRVTWGNEPFIMNPDQHLGGGNSFFRKTYLEDLGGFNERLGRKANLLLSNEEVHLRRRIASVGGTVYYHPGVCIRHFVPAERVEPKWFYRRYFWEGISDRIMERSLAEEGCSVPDAGEQTSSVQIGRAAQIRRLMKNSWHALGLFSGRADIVRGRIYMSYVFGWCFAPFALRYSVDK